MPRPSLAVAALLGQSHTLRRCVVCDACVATLCCVCTRTCDHVFPYVSACGCVHSDNGALDAHDDGDVDATLTLNATGDRVRAVWCVLWVHIITRTTQIVVPRPSRQLASLFSRIAKCVRVCLATVCVC
jgi:hypothetical protein